jgi:hypothetical protein
VGFEQAWQSLFRIAAELRGSTSHNSNGAMIEGTSHSGG